jgi:hypothetical protein
MRLIKESMDINGQEMKSLVAENILPFMINIAKFNKNS